MVVVAGVLCEGAVELVGIVYALTVAVVEVHALARSDSVDNDAPDAHAVDFVEKPADGDVRQEERTP